MCPWQWHWLPAAGKGVGQRRRPTPTNGAASPHPQFVQRPPRALPEVCNIRADRPTPAPSQHNHSDTGAFLGTTLVASSSRHSQRSASAFAVEPHRNPSASPTPARTFRAFLDLLYLICTIYLSLYSPWTIFKTSKYLMEGI
uniref:Uncharacterized protein n=1 Tax=Molossus molossus TaxID=27622 RepID=A0A7J8FYW0_MOLMO|nr:hypothetical protein HJG59_008276 [Molossus molossus]